MFQDEKRHGFFNTNNIWLNLSRLRDTLEKTGCVPELPIIANLKNIDPRDGTSPEVYQIETAMGAAISIFDDSIAVQTPRIRFSPVKRSEELLLAWSDYYLINNDFSFGFNPLRTLKPINISLDADRYRTIDDMRRCFPHGAPSLIECSSLSVSGDVIFGAGVSLRGDVRILNESGATAVTGDNVVIEGEMVIR
jgi:UTP--glucose-1-phosphate uridylyltransferase